MKMLIQKNATKLLLGLIIIVQLLSCNQKKNDYKKVMHDPNLYTTAVHNLTYVIIYDIFTPPVASRIYAYSNLAAYEVLAKEGDHFASLQGKVKGLNNIPAVYKDKKIDFPFASIIAFLNVGKQLTFSSDTMRRIIDSVKLLAHNSGMPDSLYKYSVKYGEEVGDSILSWSKSDNYAQTRGFNFTPTGLEGHWTPTPPGYFDAVEPLWKTMRCMVMDSANMFPAPGMPPFSKDTSSEFYKCAKEVMETGNHLDSTQKAIANFWDCNNFKLHVEGHAMFATKAMTPAGHWMEVIGTISKNNHADFYKTVYAYTGVSIGIYDAFICCWYTKYKYDLLRPETYINRYIDPKWMPYLQTPPFPEYNSAHSTISAAAAVVLQDIYKENTSFGDSCERPWGWPDRYYKSLDEASHQVAYSRFYGGIHYRKSVEDAYQQGKKIGALVMSKLEKK